MWRNRPSGLFHHNVAAAALLAAQSLPAVDFAQPAVLQNYYACKLRLRFVTSQSCRHVSFNLNRMKSLLPILLLTFSLLEYGNLYGQNKFDSTVINRSSIFIELLGNAPQISVNYDYLILTKNKNIKYALTIGTTHHFNNLHDFVFGPQFNTLIGRKLMAEIGLGVTIPLAFINDWVLIPRFGGRYQKMDGGMFYRLAFTPIISPASNTSILPSFGIAIGYTFKGKNEKKN